MSNASQLPEGQYPDRLSSVTDDMSDLDLIILLEKDGREAKALFIEYSHGEITENLFFTAENNKIISILLFMHN